MNRIDWHWVSVIFFLLMLFAFCYSYWYTKSVIDVVYYGVLTVLCGLVIMLDVFKKENV